MKKILISGRYPRAQTVTSYLAAWLKDHQPGFPTLRQRPAYRHYQSSSADYNASFAELYNDLDTLYQDAYQLFSNLEESFYYLRTRSDYLNQLLAARDFLGDNFTDFRKIDLKETTALVDVSYHEVLLDDSWQNSMRMDCSKAPVDFQVVSPYTTYNIVSPLENIFDDSDNTFFLAAVYSPIIAPITVQLVVDLEYVKMVNKVSLLHYGELPTSLDISSDGVTWYFLGEKQGGYAWDFPEIETRYLRIFMTKNNYDEKEQDYIYYFGLRGIQIYRKGYLGSGRLVSKPFDLQDGILQSITLHVDAEIPPMTSIDYYVNYWGDVWHRIEPSKELAVDNGREVRQEFTSTSVLLTSHGITFYAFSPPVGGIYAPELWHGEGRCLRRYTTIEDVPQDYVPVLDDFANLDFQESYDSVFFDTTDGNLFLYQLYVYYPEVTGESVYFRPMPGFTYSLYLNNAVVPVVRHHAYLSLIAGWNKVQVMVYKGGTGTRGVTWSWEPSQIRAEAGPMELVDFFDLSYSTPPGNHSRYSVYNKQIVLNYQADPSEFTYVYREPNFKTDSVRFKAELNREGAATPKLKRYELKVKVV